MTKVLDGRVALVTGASSGIGAATALSLAGAGARVALAARRADRLKQLVERVRHLGGAAAAIQVDVAEQPSAERMVATTVERFGKLDIFVNNAGVMLLATFADARGRVSVGRTWRVWRPRLNAGPPVPDSSTPPALSNRCSPRNSC